MKNLNEIEAALEAFKEANYKLEPLDVCLCITKSGSIRTLPITPKGKFLDGEMEVECEWYCSAKSAVHLISKLFS